MHIPVLQREVLEYLNPKANENFIDATVGEAGHTLAILEKNGPEGKVLGIDFTPEILKVAQLKFKKASEFAGWKTERLILVCDNFSNLEKIVKKYKFGPVSGILFDLGLSSWHLEESKRGFTFLRNEKLDMRYNPKANQLTAKIIINKWPGPEIEKILKEYGQERFAKRISKKICKTRKIKPIKTTFQLVEIVKKALPKWYLKKRLPFPQKTFQALRIAVNDELNNLKKALSQALTILKPEGKLVIISFHSLEDRIVKNFFKAKAKEGSLKILTKKPIRPSIGEIKINPRSRSAKLRAAEKLTR